MQKITLTKLYRSDKDKNGNPLKTRDGRPYERISVKCSEFGEKWLSGFSNRTNFNWKEGDDVTVEIEEKGEYLNFKTLSSLDLLEIRVAKLEEQVKKIEFGVKDDNLPM